MGWKPSRSSGVMFDKFSELSNKHHQEAVRMIQDNSFLNFSNLNKFSKHVYLYWLNENKKHCALCSKGFNVLAPFYSLEQCSVTNQAWAIINKYPDLVYKPLAEVIKMNTHKGLCVS